MSDLTGSPSFILSKASRFKRPIIDDNDLPRPNKLVAELWDAGHEPDYAFIKKDKGLDKAIVRGRVKLLYFDDIWHVDRSLCMHLKDKYKTRKTHIWTVTHKDHVVAGQLWFPGEDPKYYNVWGSVGINKYCIQHYVPNGTAFLVESFFKALAVRQAGYGVINIFNAHLTEQQAIAIPLSVKYIVLMLDNPLVDSAGLRGLQNAIKILGKYRPDITLARYDYKHEQHNGMEIKDANDCLLSGLGIDIINAKPISRGLK